MILTSFGDSFLYGSDLKDCVRPLENGVHSKKTWPALCAKEFKLEYQCRAFPGNGNFQILETILNEIDVNKNNTFYVINWSWIDRFSYVDSDLNQWCSTLPSRTNHPEIKNSTIDTFYDKYIQSELQDKFNSLLCVNQAVVALEAHNCKYIMSCIDNLMFDTRWHCPPSISFLQQAVKNKIEHFPGGTSFLEWSQKLNFAISANLHPLEEAHEKAADYWMPKVRTLLNTHAKEDYLHAFI